MNELRAQLDHLANALARANGANEDVSSFPIVGDRTKWNSDARRPIRLLSDTDKGKVSDLQPFNDERLQVLELLHFADVVRKHRRPLSINAVAQASPAGSGYIGSMEISGAFLETPGKREEIAFFGTSRATLRAMDSWCSALRPQ